MSPPRRRLRLCRKRSRPTVARPRVALATAAGQGSRSSRTPPKRSRDTRESGIRLPDVSRTSSRSGQLGPRPSRPGVERCGTVTLDNAREHARVREVLDAKPPETAIGTERSRAPHLAEPRRESRRRRALGVHRADDREGVRRDYHQRWDQLGRVQRADRHRSPVSKRPVVAGERRPSVDSRGHLRRAKGHDGGGARESLGDPLASSRIGARSLAPSSVGGERRQVCWKQPNRRLRWMRSPVPDGSPIAHGRCTIPG